MFKRVERKRKRLEEDEELGLDRDTKEMMGLNDTDTDESDSDESAQLDDSDGKDVDQEAASEDEEGTPISVTEALNDPIYLISLDPTIHGCVLCKGKLIKNKGMATSHANASAHKRRLEHFRLLSTGVDARSSAWELVKAIRSTTNVQKARSCELSKRALKRQAKLAILCDKRKRHKELKAKAIARKVSKKLSTVDEIVPTPSASYLGSSAKTQVHPEKIRKKKLESNTPTSTITEDRDSVSAKSTSPMKASRDNRKLAHKSKTKNTRKTLS